jgi:excisionase family DNA binding protein
MAIIEQGEPLAYSIPEAIRVTSLGRTNIYKLIAQGQLEARRVGRRTLIPAYSLRNLLEGITL